MKNKIVRAFIAIFAVIGAILMSGCEFEAPQDVYGPPPFDDVETNK